MEKLSFLLIVVAVVCTLITIITQLTKEVGILKKIPTSLQVLITSVIICEVILFGFLSFYDIVFIWYYPIAALFGSFLIAYICMFGWEKLLNIFSSFLIQKDGENDERN